MELERRKPVSTDTSANEEKCVILSAGVSRRRFLQRSVGAAAACRLQRAAAALGFAQGAPEGELDEIKDASAAIPVEGNRYPEHLQQMTGR